MEERKPQVGDPVVYIDPYGKVRPALITANWGQGSFPSINVVFVCNDSAMTDTYGRQIARQTSCTHMTSQQAPGNYWRYVDEPGKATEQ